MGLVIQSAKPAAGGGGGQGQVLFDSDRAYSALTTPYIPYDDTIPQDSEGTEILSVTITPADADSVLLLSYAGFLTMSTAGYVTVAVFADDDGTSDAIYCMTQIITSVNNLRNFSFTIPIDAVDTDERTYSIRVGATSGTLYVNGYSAGRRMGGAAGQFLTVQEVLPSA